MTVPEMNDLTALRAWRDATLYRLVLRAHHAEARATLTMLHSRGWTDVSLTDTALLANLDTAGTSVTALSQRAGITRQAASQQVATLEQRGYLRRNASPTDGRAWVVMQTARGRRLLKDALDIVSELERSYVDVIGEPHMQAAKRALTKLLDHIDHDGSLSSN